MATEQTPLVMEEVTDPEELAKARAQGARFDRNAAWLQAHATEVYTRHRGKCICIAGEELFVADTSEEAIARATAAHPEDDGRFFRYIPRERLARIYANYLCSGATTISCSTRVQRADLWVGLSAAVHNCGDVSDAGSSPSGRGQVRGSDV
jgi:hypothetical protein